MPVMGLINVISSGGSVEAIDGTDACLTAAERLFELLEQGGSIVALPGRLRVLDSTGESGVDFHTIPPIIFVLEKVAADFQRFSRELPAELARSRALLCAMGIDDTGLIRRALEICPGGLINGLRRMAEDPSLTLDSVLTACEQDELPEITTDF
jgi:hypothetical protein